MEVPATPAWGGDALPSARARPEPGTPLDDTVRYDERRLDVLARFSASLRWKMAAAVTMMAAILWVGGGTPAAVLAWLALALLVREIRAAAIQRLNRQHEQAIAARLRIVAVWTFALGLTQGASTLFMLQMDIAFGALLTMVLLSLAAGAVSTTYTVPQAFAAYVIGIALPALLMWVIDGGVLSIAVAAVMLMLFIVQMQFARDNLAMFRESYQMRLENMALLRDLSDERRQLAHARDTAVQADLSKSRFLAAASHDLRQPLQSMTLNIGTLTRLQRDGDEGREIAEELGASIEALRLMLDALLDVSKLDAGALRPELRVLRLDLLLAGLCKRFQPTAKARGLALHHDCMPGLAVLSDAGMLQRVISNLLDNALKFTRQGSIVLSARARGSRVQLIVEDTGIGIAPQDQQRVFEDLVQLDNPQRDRSFGHGLGLGIVRRLTRLLDIGCEMSSSLGGGTRFTLELQAADPVQAATPAGSAQDAAAPAGARRVLVLDDDASVRSAYAHGLRSLGCQVFCTATLAEALRALPVHEPQIVLVDFRLAETQNGLEAIAELRRERPGLPAIVISADTSAALREQAIRLGVPMLRKPVTEAALISAIDAGLGTGRRAIEDKAC